ncbi:helix-turn-helix domain-containing protein [Methylophaga sp.]|uniref:helix-turn-helix domain-containing protein n=1 Tax=Methylophaga sp. TaxID=2024840 RepID=UPI0027198506|nr:helix-turn-helix domain-containing protein [Methylophaga sp.]MDO8825167.1 helix-turn-helix domain-containing protein [Methylophaga sp.]
MNFREALLNSSPAGKGKMHLVERTSRDVLEQAEALPFWSQDYTQLDRGSFTGSITSVTGRNMQIFRESMNRAVDQIASAPEDTYVIGLPTIIEGNASWGGEQVKPDSLITLDKNAELLFRTSHFSEITAAVISAEHLEEYAGQVEGIDLRKVLDNVNPVEIIPTDVAHRLLAALNSSTNYISKSAGNPNIQHILRHFEDNLLDTCLQALLHASDGQERHYDQRIHRYIVNRVRELTLSSDGDCLTIGEICINLCISRRTLNHAFSRVLGITPVEYMRNLRLHRVRSELQSSPYETTIANVAAKWGFWHMSLFSRYYRELFGECPSETLQYSKALAK